MATKEDLDNAMTTLEGDFAPIAAELKTLSDQLAAALAAGDQVPQEAVDRANALHQRFASLAPAAPAPTT